MTGGARTTRHVTYLTYLTFVTYVTDVSFVTGAARTTRHWASRCCTRRRRTPSGRKLACPRHLDKPLLGNGRKYFLHLLTSEELVARGMPAGKAKLVINAYPVLVLSSEWLEELYCASCGQKRWYHLTKAPDGAISLRLAPRDLWGQVAHVDPIVPNPTVGEFTRREARRHRDQKRMFE